MGCTPSKKKALSMEGEWEDAPKESPTSKSKQGHVTGSSAEEAPVAAGVKTDSNGEVSRDREGVEESGDPPEDDSQVPATVSQDHSPSSAETAELADPQSDKPESPPASLPRLQEPAPDTSISHGSQSRTDDPISRVPLSSAVSDNSAAQDTGCQGNIQQQQPEQDGSEALCNGRLESREKNIRECDLAADSVLTGKDNQLHSETTGKVPSPASRHKASTLYWSNVADSGPPLTQHRANASYLLLNSTFHCMYWLVKIYAQPFLSRLSLTFKK